MIIYILTSCILKTGDALRFTGGWLTIAGVILADMFAGHVFLVNFIIVMTFIDAVWGTTVSIKKGRFALSELMRQTVGKMAVYACAIFGMAGIDYYICSQTGLQMTLSTAIVGIVIALAEIWSSTASMLILFPHFPVLRLLQKALTGEIARKLGVSEDEVRKSFESNVEL